MMSPAPSLSPSRAIDTSVAAPVTTTWNDSNSFSAAEIFAELVALLGGWAAGRIFTADGATQTCAAEADPAAAEATTTSARTLKVPAPGWLFSAMASAVSEAERRRRAYSSTAEIRSSHTHPCSYEGAHTRQPGKRLPGLSLSELAGGPLVPGRRRMPGLEWAERAFLG